MISEITHCRICGNQNIEEVLNLGEQFLTGTFPRVTEDFRIPRGPLKLVKCIGTNEVCGLLQLGHSYDLEELYGTNYGYRSGLNYRMVQHLESKVNAILDFVNLENSDLVIDIGSNDGTTLGFFPDNLVRVGVDPTAEKFREHYKPGIRIIADFFSANAFQNCEPNRKAKVITSFSMFYDLEDPLDFASQIREVLHKDGVWVLEQSYLPTMLEKLAYDTVCHEHLEYYALSQIEWILNRAGLKLIDVELNDVNGGSFSIIAAHVNSTYQINSKRIDDIRFQEKKIDLDNLATYVAFRERVELHRRDLRAQIADYQARGLKVFGLGASTKGNVLLQYCNFGPEDIQAVGDINSDKVGAFTPGTWIPIISEAELLDSHPDILLVLPWHFRSFFEESALFKGLNLLFPLPEIELISR